MLRCSNLEKEYDVAQKKLEEHWASHPGDTTSDQYKKLAGWELTAKAAYEAAQAQVEDARGALAVAEAEKTCAEKEKKYEVAQVKLAVHKAANPGDTTSDGYKKLKAATATAKAAYEVAQGELAVAEKKKDYAVAQMNLEAYAAAHPSDTTSARYKALKKKKVTAYAAAQTQVKVVHTNQALLQAEREREKAEKRRAEEEKKNYEVAQKELEEYTVTNPDDATSAWYKKLKERELTAKAAYEEMRCAEKKKDYAVAQMNLEAYAAAHPSDTPLPGTAGCIRRK